MAGAILETWLRLEAEAATLAAMPGAFDLHAFLVKTDYAREETRLRGVIADLRVRDAPEAVIAEHTSFADEAAAAYADPSLDPRGQWVITGGMGDASAKRLLNERFETLSISAARALGLSSSPDRCVQEWLHIVAGNCTALVHLQSDWGRIERLCEASSLVCRKIAESAAILPSSMVDAMARPMRTAQQTRYPNRAAWLKEKIDSGISSYRIRANEGPDKKTIARILRGEHVNSATTDKLARALQVSRHDIPDD